MNLATRCPACGTTFKVVQDQLRMSDGWVRCGRCSEIFDGNEHLQSAEAAVATEVPDKSAFDFPDFSGFPSSPPANSAVRESAPESEAVDEQQPEAPVATDAVEKPVPAPWLGSWPSLELKPGTPAVAPAIAPAPAVAVAVPEVPFDVARASALAEPAAQTSTVAAPESSPGGESSGFATLDQPEGTFKRWLRRIPGLDRLPLRTIGAGALVLLGAQMVYQSRDAIAARQPSLQPALTAMCKAAGCALSPLRQIDSITIDGASFARDPGGEGYQLAFTLRNRAAIPLAMPAVEVTLLDTQEQAVVRRVLLPADFNAPEVLPANTERSTVLPLAISPAPASAPALAPVAGYGIAAFYP